MSADALPLRLATIRRHERRRAAGVVVALLAAIVVFVACEVVVGGSADIPLSDIPLAAVGRGEGLAHYVVFETRMPRALTAVLAGALFGLAGQIYQRLVGNVLATPDILGISAGAAAAATAVLTLGIVGVGVQLAAVGGSLVVGIAVFALSWRGGVAPYRLVLVGIGLGACASAVTTYLVTRADEMSIERALRWMIGSLSGADWQGVGILAATFALGGVAAIALAPALRTFALGDDLAAGLGTRVSRVRRSRPASRGRSGSSRSSPAPSRRA